MIEIDGSVGEGGGQIVRSSLALSAITGKPVAIKNIRAKRKKSGLLRQHLTAVKAAAAICNAEVEGAELHASELAFWPRTIEAGEYFFRIGSAGSSCLVLQTVLPALMLADGPSLIRVEGGTHNTKAPPFDFLQSVYLPLVARMGPSFESQLLEYGFYPAGGGSIQIRVTPARQLAGLRLMHRTGRPQIGVNAVVSRLPSTIAERELDTIRRQARFPIAKLNATVVERPRGPGNIVMIGIAYENIAELFIAFGSIGVRAEQVARHAVRQVQNYLAHQAPVGEYLADQLLLPAGLAAQAGQKTCFRTVPLSEHSRTHIDVLLRFLEIEIEVKPAGELVEVRLARR